ncbi:hypothetical protein [Streptomyces albogriseolus]|uniref:hypothetical protein n=1 Tax=Streptomyces albogriseolus TaxID=1887 RepID=UPI003460EC06
MSVPSAVQVRDGVDPVAQGLAEVAGVQVGTGGEVGEGGEEVVGAGGRKAGLELFSAFLPGTDGLGGGRGDGQASAVSAGLVVVPDQGDLVVAGLQAVAGQGEDFQGPPAGVSEQDVQRAVHQLQVVGGEGALAAGPPQAEKVEVGVELADHRFGDRLADLVLVSLLFGDAVEGGVTDEGGREVVRGSGAAAVVDQGEEVAGDGHAVVPAGRFAVPFQCRADRVDHGGDVVVAQACGVVGSRALREGPGGEFHAAQCAGELVRSRALLDGPGTQEAAQPRLPDGAQINGLGLPDTGRGAGALAERTQIQDVVLRRRSAGVLRMACPDRRTHAAEHPQDRDGGARAHLLVRDAADERAGLGQVPHHAADLRRFEDPQPRVHLLQTVENLPAQQLGQRQETELVRGKIRGLLRRPRRHSRVRVSASVLTETLRIMPAQAPAVQARQRAGRSRAGRSRAGRGIGIRDRGVLPPASSLAGGMGFPLGVVRGAQFLAVAGPDTALPVLRETARLRNTAEGNAVTHRHEGPRELRVGQRRLLLPLFAEGAEDVGR